MSQRVTDECLYPDLRILEIARNAISYGNSHDWYMSLLWIRDGIKNALDDVVRQHDENQIYKE